MSAEIISLADRRAKRPEHPSLDQIVLFSTEDLLSNWEKFAANNCLNDFFLGSTPSWSKDTINYLEDLTAISTVEQKINLEPQTTAPAFSADNALGWIASFRINGKIISTPFMPTEQYARSFNVLLFLKVKRELVKNSIQIQS